MGMTQQALGRHVIGRAEHAAGRGEAAARIPIEVDDRGLFGQAEVEQLYDAALVDEDVGGLDVAMHDALLVCGVEGVGNLNGEVDHFNGRQTAAGGTLLQRFAAKHLHRDEGVAFELVDLIDGTDVRVIQRGCGLRFALELPDRGRVGCKVVGDELERDGPSKTRIVGFVDDPHPSGAQKLDHVIPRNCPANHACTGRSYIRAFGRSCFVV